MSAEPTPMAERERVAMVIAAPFFIVNVDSGIASVVLSSSDAG
jgi:hypothetical protein